MRRDETLHAVFAFYYEAFPEDICMRGEDLGAREAWRWRVREAWQEMSHASENITTWGLVAYCHTHTYTHAYKIEKGRKSERTGARDERENIESLRRNIARCVMHERASDSRRVNSLWIDAIKQKKHTKSPELGGVILLRSWYRIACVSRTW